MFKKNKNAGWKTSEFWVGVVTMVARDLKPTLLLLLVIWWVIQLKILLVHPSMYLSNWLTPLQSPSYPYSSSMEDGSN